MSHAISGMIKDDSYSDHDIIQRLLRLYPEPEERKEFVTVHRPTLLLHALRTPLMWSLVRFLLRSGANPNLISESGMHILSFCSTVAGRVDPKIALHDIDNLVALLAYGADPNASGQASSVLYSEVAFGYHHVVPTLLAHGARMSDNEYVSLRMTHPEKLKLVADFYSGVSLRRIACHHIVIARVRELNEY